MRSHPFYNSTLWVKSYKEGIKMGKKRFSYSSYDLDRWHKHVIQGHYRHSCSEDWVSQRGLIGPPPWLRNFAQDHCTPFTIKHSMGKVWARLGQRESRVPSYFMDCIMQYWWKWCWRSLVLKQSLNKAVKNKKKRLDTVVTYIYLYKYSLHELAISKISILTNMKEF